MKSRYEKCPVFIPPKDHSLPEPREERDFLIVRLIHEYDGLLTDDQIKQLVAITDGPFEQRMRRLVYHGYIHRMAKWKRDQYSFGAYWLAERGARYVAGLAGEAQRWRDYCFGASRKWPGVRNPRFDNLIHDAQVVDVRLCVEASCQVHRHLQMREWVQQSTFKADPDRVVYRNRKGREVQRNFIPDGLFIIDDMRRRLLYRLLLELDMGTKDGHKMLDQKLLIGAHYVTSEQYQKRFGTTQGWFAYVTKDEQRANLLKHYVERYRPLQAQYFYFTTFGLIQRVGDILTKPIWWRGDNSEKVALLAPT